MENVLVATAVVLRELGCFSLDSLDDRIMLQKKVYLAQDAGVRLGYGYSWYVHGPYSPDLTTDAYQIIPEGVGAIEDKVIKEHAKSLLDKVNNLINDKPQEAAISDVQWYELLSSVAYWFKHKYTEAGRLLERVKETKPQFSAEQIKAAIASYLNFHTSKEAAA